jgi:LysR family transcriptional regulator of beta-lactamase
MAAEGLDLAIRFGSGSWHGTEALRLFDAPLSPLCTPKLAERLRSPADLVEATLLRSYRADEWSTWFAAANVPPAAQVNAGIVFDSSLAMMEAALQGLGIALAPPSMFSRHLSSGAIRQPFPTTISLGSYWLTRLQSRPPTAAMLAFSDWITSQMSSASQ